MKNKLIKFCEALDEYGEYFFSSGNVKQDYEQVTSVLKAQGYWSGTTYRLYFDEDFNLTSVQEKSYGF